MLGGVVLNFKKTFSFNLVVTLLFSPLLVLLVFKVMLYRVTRVAGIEPTRVVLKTTVLPLNYTP